MFNISMPRQEQEGQKEAGYLAYLPTLQALVRLSLDAATQQKGSSLPR